MPQWRPLQIGRALYTMQWILFNHVNVKQSFLQEACLPVKRTWGLGSVGCLRPPALLPFTIIFVVMVSKLEVLGSSLGVSLHNSCVHFN